MFNYVSPVHNAQVYHPLIGTSILVSYHYHLSPPSQSKIFIRKNGLCAMLYRYCMLSVTLMLARHLGGQWRPWLNFPIQRLQKQ